MSGQNVPLLELRGISKTFPGVTALDGVELSAYPGQVLAPMGENGAGKSTLMKILSGAYQADPGGQILIDGKAAAITDPIAAKRHGIAIIYQELAVDGAPDIVNALESNTQRQEAGRGDDPDAVQAGHARQRRRLSGLDRQVGITGWPK